MKVYVSMLVYKFMIQCSPKESNSEVRTILESLTGQDFRTISAGLSADKHQPFDKVWWLIESLPAKSQMAEYAQNSTEIDMILKTKLKPIVDI